MSPKKKKLDDSKKSGAGADNIYVPHLFYFEEFKFLDDIIVIRKTNSNFSLDDTLERTDDVVNDTQENNEFSFTQQIGEPSSQITTDRHMSDEVLSPPFLPQSAPSQMTSGGSANTSRRQKTASLKTNKYDDAIAAILTPSFAARESESKYSDFGKSIAKQLEELTTIEASLAMGELQQVMSQRVVESLSRRSSSSHSSNILLDAMIESEIL